MGDEIRNCRDVETRLTPYVDGESGADDARAIDGHLAACPPCRHEAEAERGGRDLVRSHREELRAAAPERLRARCLAQAAPSRTATLRRWVPLSLAASLLVAAAGAIIFNITRPIEALAAGLALDHVKCFHFCDIDHTIDAAAAQARWQQKEGWAIVVPPAETTEDLQLVDVRRCISTDGLAAHLLYRWRGQPLSVYVMPNATEGEALVEPMGYETAVWSDAGRTYAVVTPGHPQAFDQVVRYVRAHAR
jgi:anti-sigma factor (TIGR02949 family)